MSNIKHAQQETPHFKLQYECPIGHPTPHIAECFGLTPILQKALANPLLRIKHISRLGGWSGVCTYIGALWGGFKCLLAWFWALLALWGVLWALQERSEVDLRRGMNSVNFYGGASSQLARIATISGRPAKSWKKSGRKHICFSVEIWSRELLA